jgi:hypothetical protein
MKPENPPPSLRREGHEFTRAAESLKSVCASAPEVCFPRPRLFFRRDEREPESMAFRQAGLLVRWLNAHRGVKVSAVVKRAVFHHQAAAADVADVLRRISLHQ